MLVLGQACWVRFFHVGWGVSMHALVQLWRGLVGLGSVGMCHRCRVRHLDSSSGEVVLAVVEQVGAVFTLHSRREDDGEYIVRRGDST